MKAVFLVLAALLLVGCEDRYRYPCQDPENKDNPQCNLPMCEVDGFCFDKLNGIESQSVEEPPATDCNCATENTEVESTGE